MKYQQKYCIVGIKAENINLIREIKKTKLYIIILFKVSKLNLKQFLLKNQKKLDFDLNMRNK